MCGAQVTVRSSFKSNRYPVMLSVNFVAPVSYLRDSDGTTQRSGLENSPRNDDQFHKHDLGKHRSWSDISMEYAY